ncbi:hypothetical protein [Caballeronia sp. LZ001]|uniref:hypothetical protein n=1 Tax=Caballeronia sp. LZ001 TaxID=3038553 RepID=UPI002857D52D|nr:hypothetical protein [Caballeronia sp. LZ001]MDR5806641.1 hypothetical protein [Caballeronia sp. LZ001]
MTDLGRELADCPRRNLASHGKRCDGSGSVLATSTVGLAARAAKGRSSKPALASALLLIGCRFGVATLVQIAAAFVAITASWIGVAIALLCVAFFLLPPPKPRYNPREELSEAEKTSNNSLR